MSNNKIALKKKNVRIYLVPVDVRFEKEKNTNWKKDKTMTEKGENLKVTNHKTADITNIKG